MLIPCSACSASPSPCCSTTPSKWLYGKKRILPLMPLLLARLLVAVVMLFHIPMGCMAESHWLLWLLERTVAFAVPVYENRQLIRRHWLSLSVGVVASVVMAVGGTVLLARWLDLRHAAAQSGDALITTPFAVEATRAIGGQTNLATPRGADRRHRHGGRRERAYPAGHSQPTRQGGGVWCSAPAPAREAYQMGNEEGVVSSMVMMIAKALGW
ncbi:LrgB family protein [Aeromonas sp. A-5]|uniref:LrgB family protein n=1 Tax=Aeromonas ichthyocola TaxID=3367746 RepID=UPI0038F0E684